MAANVAQTVDAPAAGSAPWAMLTPVSGMMRRASTATSPGREHWHSTVLPSCARVLHPRLPHAPLPSAFAPAVTAGGAAFSGQCNLENGVHGLTARASAALPALASSAAASLC